MLIMLKLSEIKRKILRSRDFKLLALTLTKSSSCLRIWSLRTTFSRKGSMRLSKLDQCWKITFRFYNRKTLLWEKKTQIWLQLNLLSTKIWTRQLSMLCNLRRKSTNLIKSLLICWLNSEVFHLVLMLPLGSILKPLTNLRKVISLMLSLLILFTSIHREFL